MATKKLKVLGTGINPNAVTFVKQNLTDKQKAQTRENIGASTYYHTKREELRVEHEDISTEYIYGLYDALMAQYPDNVQKNEVNNDDGTFANYEYVISTGEYSMDGSFAQTFGADLDIKKPKYLISSGVHGIERNAALSTYQFIRDVFNGHNVPHAFKEGVIIHVLPVANPDGFDAFTYENAGGVNINRNFEAETKAKETQAISNWLKANKDADLYIDVHNGSALNEIVAIIGDSDNDAVNTVKKIALKGVGRIIPFWREVVGYPSEVEVITAYKYDDDTNTYTDIQLGNKPVIFSNCADADIDSAAFGYASNVLSIPSVLVEIADYHGDYSKYNPTLTIPQTSATYPSANSPEMIEAIASGAEAIGNILLEFYEQSFMGKVVNDMKVVNSKLDNLLAQVNSGFHIERGTFVLEADMTDGGNIVNVSVPCPSGAQMFTLQPDADTLTKIKATTKADGIEWMVGLFGQCGRTIGTGANRGLQRRMMTIPYQGNEFWMEGDQGTACNNADGFSFNVHGIKAGTYNWTAYYWDE